MKTLKASMCRDFLESESLHDFLCRRLLEQLREGLLQR